jgi:hypothetical protein
MEKTLFGVIGAVVVMIVGFALYPTLTSALTNANLSADQSYLGTLAKTLYILGVSLISIVIIVVALKSSK